MPRWGASCTVGRMCGAPREGTGTMWPQMYVDVAWLKGHLDSVSVIDARRQELFLAGHIPQAVSLHWTSLANMSVEQGEPGWAALPGDEELARRLARVGIDGSRTVVVYAESTDGWGEDGYLLWALHRAGVSDARLLAGGWAAWCAREGAVATTARETPASPHAVIPHVGLDEIEQGGAAPVFVDARLPREFSGEWTMGEARGGHIPGAHSLPATALLSSEGLPLAPEELVNRAEEAGIGRNDHIITYCTGGVRAAFVAELLHVVGFRDVSVYACGYSEWASDGARPVDCDWREEDGAGTSSDDPDTSGT